jgi:hypothetical protein
MTFSITAMNLKRCGQGAALGVAALALAACASTNLPPVPAQPEVDSSGQPIIEAGDVAIAGQLVSHSIMDLPEVADASKPPLVRFSGVTSIVNGPVDTAPYTGLLRDRLLLLTREKLRFVERQLPPLGAHKSKHKAVGGPIDVDTDADYEITAQLRGNYDDDTYLMEVRFIDIHSGVPSFSGDYRIGKEAQAAPAAAPTASAAPPDQHIESTDPTPIDVDAPPPPPRQPAPSDNPGMQ